MPSHINMLPFKNGVLWMLLYTVAVQVNRTHSSKTSFTTTSSWSSSPTTSTEQTTGSVTPNSGDVPDNITCDTTTGACLHGCQDGFAMPLCDIRCPTDCSRCTHNPDTNKTICEACSGNNYLENGQCTPCPSRCLPNVTSPSSCFMDNGTCRFGCINGAYGGDKCSRYCDTKCRGRKCDQFSGVCVDGCIRSHYCSDTCSMNCGNGCVGQVCNHDCTCRTACHKDFYGVTCETRCPNNCIKQSTTTTRCNVTTGSCIYGCIRNEWWGDTCDIPCSTNCRDGTCLPEDGNCIAGCTDNWFGPHCSFPCYENCVNQNCSETNGTCMEGCKHGWFGPTCEHRCSFRCMNDICDDINGECTDGCTIGWFGPTCNKSCSKTCHLKECDFHTGTCTHGCSPGFEGAQCMHQPSITPPEDGTISGLYIGVAVGLALVAASPVAILLILYKRRTMLGPAPPQRSEDVISTHNDSETPQQPHDEPSYMSLVASASHEYDSLESTSGGVVYKNVMPEGPYVNVFNVSGTYAQRQ